MMKAGKICIWILVFLMLLTGCTGLDVFYRRAESVSKFPAETNLLPENTLPPETLPPSVPEETEPVTQPEPVHSDLYIPGASVEDVILYFNEVCLDAEYVHGGDPGVVQKWTAPVGYYLHGEPTQQDRQVLLALVWWLNSLEGFPGMEEVSQPHLSNLDIYFCGEEEMIRRMGAEYTGLDGAVTFWYQDNQIYEAIICCRTDLEQSLRNSVLQEEIYNGLGPVQDTDLRPDSIIYSGFSQPQDLTQMDRLILTLLYHPQIQCGMDAQQCEDVIRSLYY